MKSSKAFFALILSLVLVLAPTSYAARSDDKFDAQRAKRILLQLANEKPDELPEVQPKPAPGSPQEAFLNYYFKEMMPVFIERGDAIKKYLSYQELIDAGLYENERQRKHWQKFIEAADEVLNKYSASPEWEAKKVEWARLSEGLTGDLAESARQMVKDLKFTQFPPSAQPLLKEQSDLYLEIERISNTSPFKSKMQENEIKASQTVLAFFDGKLSFTEAAKIGEQLDQEGSYAFGEDVATRGRDYLNRYAQIQTELAQMKGYKTNADFTLASQADAYAPQLQGKENLLKFLYGLLDSTDAIIKKYYDLRAQQVAGKPFEQLRPEESGLLGFKTYLLMRDFFPQEKLVDIWHKTMLESGFSKETLDRIIVDAYPRKNKNSHAYMRPLRSKSPSKFIIDGQSLNEIVVDGKWDPAWIYILQNNVQDGLGHLRTDFHEGGHALHHSFQENLKGFDSAYGFEETHSMTMEYFMTDKDFLMANGRKRDGTAPTEDVVDLFIKRTAIGDLIGFRGSVENAIYDIELWDYDYVKGPQTFVERSLELADKLYKRVNFREWPKDMKAYGYSHFVTSHFRSGSVRYYGYVVAEVSSALMAQSLYDKLEKETGRRTLYKQPSLAQKLIDGIYRNGIEKPFPLSVEAFTGMAFSPDNYAKQLNDRVGDFIKELEAQGNSNCGPLLDLTHAGHAVDKNGQPIIPSLKP